MISLKRIVTQVCLYVLQNIRKTPAFQQHSQRREAAPTRCYAADLHWLGRVLADTMAIAWLGHFLS
jgi:hypothetical protein